MSHNLNDAVAVVGIDMARTRSTSSASIAAVRSCCVRSGRVAKLKHALPTCHLV